MDGEMSEKDREREKRGVEREKLLSKIYGICTIGFCLIKMKSRSTHRELPWVSKSWSFVKLHEVGNVPALVISSLKVI